MKNGLMFFLSLHSYVKIARILLIPAVFFLFFARGVLLMTVSIVILAFLFLISIIRAPSDEEFLKGIKQFHEEFQKGVAADTETKRYSQAKILTGYRRDGGFSMKRHINGDTVYSYILDVGIARRGTEFFLYTDALDLLRKGEPQRKQYAITSLNFRYKYEPIPNQDAAILEFMLLETNTHLSMLVESDYHLREFLDMLQVFEK